MTSQVKTFLALTAMLLMVSASIANAEQAPVDALPSQMAPSDAAALAAEPSEATPSDAAPSAQAPSDTAPAPEQTGRSRYFDNHRSILSVGWGLALPEKIAPVDFDGYVQMQVLHPRRHEQRVSDGALADLNIDTYGLVGAAGVAGRVRF